MKRIITSLIALQLMYIPAGFAVSQSALLHSSVKGIDLISMYSAPSGSVARTETNGLKGTYTVGLSSEANYPSVTAAVNAMKNGIDGPVVLEVESGKYNELINVPDIPGTSSINTITIKSKSGNCNDVIFCYDQYTEPASSSDKMAQDYGVFTVSGADYLSLEGVTVTSTNLLFPSLIYIKNVSQNFTVRNCHLYAEMSTSYSADLNLIYIYAANVANMNSDYFTLENSLLEGGYIGASIGGTGYVALPKEKGARIMGNIFRNQGSKSIYLRDEADAKVLNNLIFNDQTNKSDFNAMDIYRGIGNLSISGNAISLATKNYASGIYLRPVTGTTGNHVTINNNEINFTSCVGASFGIVLSSNCSYMDVAYNTIRMAGASTSCATVLMKDLPSNITFQNNLLQNESGGYVYRANNLNYLAGVTFTNNALYTSGSTTFAYAGSAIADFAGWNQLAKETNSFVEKADFISPELLDLNTPGNLISGKPVELVTTDLNGNPRSTTTPTIGAYEYSATAANPCVISGFPYVKELSHSKAMLNIKLSGNGKVFFLAKGSSAITPTKEEILAGGNLIARKEKEGTFTVENLSSQTGYKVYFLVQSLHGESSEIIEGPAFTTPCAPTSISTFENVTVKEGDFEDGTALFKGFTVESISNGVGSSTKAAKLNNQGTITLTNSANGLVLNGFFLNTDASVQVTIFQGSMKKGTKNFTSTNDGWIFCNLKDMGEITSVQLSGNDNIFIDDFSGTPQSITFLVEDKVANEGDQVNLSAEIYGGVIPYTYAWKNAKEEILSTDANCKFDATHTGVYSLTVTDAWGNIGKGETVVRVSGDAVTATFDDLYLAPENHWRGNEESDEMYRTFYSGSYAFSNYLMKSWDTWALFGYSNETSTEFNSANAIKEQFRSSTGGGVNGSKNYAIVYASSYMGNSTASITNKAEGDTIKGCYISNSAWGKYAVENRDGLTPGAFTTGDWFKLTAEGKKADGTKSSCDFYLADYRSGKEKDHYCLNTWEWFDLRVLGKVTEVKFSMSSSRNNSYGIATPTYFCMDDFNGVRSVTEKEKQTVSNGETKSMALDSFFSFSADDASVTYEIEDDCDNQLLEAEISDQNLQLKAIKTGNTSLVISATKKGRKEFIKLPVSINQGVGINGQTISEINIYPVPAVDKLNISTNLNDYTIEVTNIKGNTMIIQKNNLGNSFINTSNLENGVYLLKIKNKETIIVKRFIKAN